MSKTKEIKRERFNISEEEIDDFTGYGPWELNGETYKFVEDYSSRDCDGECHNVVTQRESDKKYFEFTWMYSYSQTYYYEGDWKEVFRKEVTTISWE